MELSKGLIFTNENCVGCNKCINVCSAMGACVSTVADDTEAFLSDLANKGDTVSERDLKKTGKNRKISVKSSLFCVTV